MIAMGWKFMPREDWLDHRLTVSAGMHSSQRINPLICVSFGAADKE